MQEGLQAFRGEEASGRMLSMHEFGIEPSGKDRYDRVLVRFNIGDMTAGELGLAGRRSVHRARWICNTESNRRLAPQFDSN
jgi:hypothetical protein